MNSKDLKCKSIESTKGYDIPVIIPKDRRRNRKCTTRDRM